MTTIANSSQATKDEISQAAHEGVGNWPYRPINMSKVLTEGGGVNNYSAFRTFMDDQDPDKFLWLHFPEGIWTSYPDSGSGFRAGFKLRRGNVKITGAGRFKTKLIGTNSFLGPTFCVYNDRQNGYQLNSDSHYTIWPMFPGDDDLQYPFEDSTDTFGRDYLTLKVSSHANNFAVGDHVCIQSGNSGFQLDRGEYNIIREVDATNGILYFAYPLLRDFRTISSPTEITLNQNGFTQPSIGNSVSITVSNGGTGIYVTNTGTYNYYITIENNLYQVTAGWDTNNLTIKNIGNVGNQSSGQTIGATGSKVMRRRVITNISKSSSHDANYGNSSFLRNPGNVVLEDLSIHGYQYVFDTSGVIGAVYNRIRIVDEYTGSTASSINTLIIDSGRDITFNDCDIICQSKYPKGHVASRFATDIVYNNCRQTQHYVGIGEYSANMQINGGSISLSNPDTSGTDFAITIGADATGLKIDKTRISCRNVKYLVSGQYIAGQNSSTTWRSELESFIKNCNINVVNMGNLIYNCAQNTRLKFTDNTIRGNVSSLISDGAIIVDPNIDARFPDKPHIEFSRNDVKMALDYIFPRGSRFTAENNTIEVTGPNTTFNEQKGFVILDYTNPTSTLLKHFNIRNNKFIGVPMHFRTYYPSNYDFNTCDISNNKHSDSIQAATPVSYGFLDSPNFTFNYDIANFPAILRRVGAASMDKTGYFNRIIKNGGAALTDAQKGYIETFVDAIYTAGIREKIIRLNPMCGDYIASLTPLIGHEYPVGVTGAVTGIDLLFGGMTSGDYSDTAGWHGDGSSKGIRVLSFKVIDFRNFGLVAQTTAGDTSVTDGYHTLIGYDSYWGNNLASLTMERYSGTYYYNPIGKLENQGISLGGGTSSYGFFYSGKLQYSTQLNYKYDNVAEVNNTSAGGDFATYGSGLNIYGIELLSGLNGNTPSYSDAKICAYAVTNYLSLTEVQALKNAFFALSTSLGRTTPA